ncbi:unnamed protein product [Linum tenue]|uniref:Uncharacterized protein n=1 Tax=Linum tenue TaxID=586396 RepID=A0AAV0I3W1_9ROSI|nr:unnamed protein product [Linum tenue]
MAHVLHMNGGTEDTSYAANSLLQRKVISMTRPIIEEAAMGLFSSSSFSGRNLAIADLGCASGPNTLFTVSELIKALDKASRKLGHVSLEFQVFLNDLPGNDFNNVFRSLHGFTEEMKQELGIELPMFFNGVPGSFYGKLLPSDSLHFIHSSYSLHWLSRVPPGLEEMNKGNISIGSSSPPGVLKAYYTQFQTDFSFFLSCRAQELVRGGQIIFTLLGRKSQGPSTTPSIHLLELLFVVLNQMASEGLIDQEKLDSFDLPFYMPSPMEVETEIQKQGSFTIKRLEVWESNWNPHDMEVNLPETLQDGGHNVARCIRAVMEPQLVSQFALQRKIVDEVFMRYRVILSNWMCEKEALYVNITVSLTKH